jgi:hypothetical protein
MKILNKLKINSDRFMNNEELMNLRGGNEPSYPSYRCYWLLGGPLGGTSCTHFISYINTASCAMAYQICNEFGGGCVEGGDCSPL